MRRMTTILAVSSLFVLPMVGCGEDDPSEDAPAGKGGSTSGKGGSTSGKGGTTAGKGGSANTGGDTTGTGGDTTGTGGDTTGTGGDTTVAGAGGGGPTGCDIANLPACGDLPHTGTAAGNCVYEIAGRTDITGTLTIEPCTKILGAGDDDVIVVIPGGQLFADGTADAPIVFTSAQATPAKGDWGGLVIAGNAVCNDAVEGGNVASPLDDVQCEVEGFATNPPEYGQVEVTATNDESSGSLSYVRIEYPGVNLGGGKEINGLTLAGVGSGTTISHVMVNHALDDCFEFFGGTVNADHLICNDPDDDMFDTDSGFSGHVQFAFGRQIDPLGDDTSGSNGFEMDNDTSLLAAKLPVSTPQFSNVTLCGTGLAPLGIPKVGALLRRGTAGTLMNVLLTGFETASASVRDLPDTTITMPNATAWGNGLDTDANNALDDTWFTDNAIATADPTIGDCWANPPVPFPAAAIAGGTPTGHADEAATFEGAFEDAAGDWMTGAWVSWD